MPSPQNLDKRGPHIKSTLESEEPVFPRFYIQNEKRVILAGCVVV